MKWKNSVKEKILDATVSKGNDDSFLVQEDSSQLISLKKVQL